MRRHQFERGPDGEVRADPSQLQAGAQICWDLGESLGLGLVDVEPETVHADKGLPGWHTQKALQELLWWWRDDLGRLRQRLEATGEGLEACARDYRHTDHANAGHFSRAAGRW